MLLTVQMFADWWSNLNVFIRALILLADLGLLGYFTWKRLLPPLLHPPNVEACALMVEKYWPRFRGRVIASVQFGKGRSSADSPELINVVQKETDSGTAMMNFGAIIPTKMLARRLYVALVVSAIFGALMFFLAPASTALFERVFLIPAKVPRKTDIDVINGNKIIPSGEGVIIEAMASGIVPAHGRVTLEDDSGKIREITIDPLPDDPDHFSLKIDRVEQPLTYTIRINDATSDTYSVKTIPRPDVTAIDCVQVYPAYTGLPDTKRTVGNLALLAGSKLKIHATTNSKVVKAVINLIGINKTLPLTFTATDNSELTGEIEIPATGLTAFAIQITNQAGITSGDETQYRIDLIPDHPPTIDLTYPERLQELYTLKAKPNIGFVANDDYGLVKVTLCYRLVADTDNNAPVDPNAPAATTAPVKTIEMDLGGGHPQNMKNRYPWDLSAIKPPLVEGNTIEYWMEAEDGNNVTGPGITDSEHHTIKIVSETEKKAEIMNRLVDSLSTLTDINQTQQKINEDLGNIIQGKTTTPNSSTAPKQ
jgi:hypothetical protein